MRYLRFSDFDSVLILAFLSTLGITLANDVSNPDDTTRYKLCSSQTCNTIGNEIIESLDQSVSPCDDFYKHSCGRNLDSIPMTLDNGNNDLRMINKLKRLIEILEEHETSDNKTMDKAKRHYRSCMNLAAIDARGIAPLESMVLANGGWPLLLPSKNWRLEDHNLTLQKILENYGKAVDYSLFSIRINTVLKPLFRLFDSLEFGSSIVPTSLYLFKSQGTNQTPDQRNRRDRWNSTYSTYIKAVAAELVKAGGSKMSSANLLDHDVAEMLEFETSLRKLYLRDRQLTNRINRMSVNTLQIKWDKAVSGYPEYAIDWLKLIHNAFNGTGLVITTEEPISVSTPNIFEELADLLKKNNLRTVVNYVHWHAINKLALHTNKEMRRITNEWFANIGELVFSDANRHLFCTYHHIMPRSLSYAYVQQYFDPNTLLTAYTIVNQIQAELIREVDQSTWIDDQSKDFFKHEIYEMLHNIGYSSVYHISEDIDEYYSNLEIGSNYFDNVVNSLKFDTRTLLMKLLEPYDISKIMTLWLLEPVDIHVRYFWELNPINLLAINLEMPLFHSERPLVMNYGGIGAIVGHEVARQSHFIGRQADEIPYSTKVMYNKTEKCFIDQYRNYTLSKNHPNEISKINGMKIPNEYGANNGGFHVGLRAYKSFKKYANFSDITISVLRNYTDQQLYFYSLSNTLCPLESPDVDLKEDYYNPYSMRINRIVANMPEFSETFNCPIGSLMNPVNKCGL